MGAGGGGSAFNAKLQEIGKATTVKFGNTKVSLVDPLNLINDPNYGKSQLTPVADPKSVDTFRPVMEEIARGRLRKEFAKGTGTRGSALSGGPSRYDPNTALGSG